MVLGGARFGCGANEVGVGWLSFSLIVLFSVDPNFLSPLVSGFRVISHDPALSSVVLATKNKKRLKQTRARCKRNSSLFFF